MLESTLDTHHGSCYTAKCKLINIQWRIIVKISNLIIRFELKRQSTNQLYSPGSEIAYQWRQRFWKKRESINAFSASYHE